jgi:hypothetical protein
VAGKPPTKAELIARHNEALVRKVAKAKEILDQRLPMILTEGSISLDGDELLGSQPLFKWSEFVEALRPYYEALGYTVSSIDGRDGKTLTIS